jgi:hypothetical protein
MGIYRNVTDDKHPDHECRINRGPAHLWIIRRKLSMDPRQVALNVGILACAILAVALFALYKEHLLGAWRWIFVVTAVASLYLNVVVLIVQSFVKVSALNALASTQSELPFVITQVVVLAVFILIALIAVIKFRPGTSVRV